jgi:hypothetical protein
MVYKEKTSPRLTSKPILILGLLLCLITPSLSGAEENGASLYLSPPSGAYAVGDTFSVSVYLNTNGRYVNAIEADLRFPPDKLQIVSPSIGKSVIDVWVGQPAYSNSNGTVAFRGAIPNPGLNVSQGLVSTFTFRVKATGKAVVEFTDKSKVLLNDGKGTDVLSNTAGAIFDLILPPPQGPIVTSPSHSDQSRWYPNSSVVLEWHGDDDAEAFSYSLDAEPVGVPDETPEPRKSAVSYTDVADGVHYFHIRAHRGGVWSGVTHFAVRVDQSPPADFELGIDPYRTTTTRRPIVSFETTDAHSGLNHYEIKLIPLSRPETPKNLDKSEPQEFFIEATSPYIPELSSGKYDLIVRAYDNAGNFREVKDRLRILSSGAGVLTLAVPTTPLGFLFLLIALIVAALLSYKYFKWHAHLSEKHLAGAAGSAEIAKKLAKLREYQKKYGHLAVLIALGFSALITPLLSFPGSVRAQESVSLPPPIITTVSEGITNDQIFYVGGKYPIPGTFITVYLQNEDTGEAKTFLSVSDSRGDWFYVNDNFLPAGSYVLWAQASSKGGIKSPPSAQHTLEVATRAVSIGSSRVSLELLYQAISLVLIIITLFLILRAYYYYRLANKRHQLLMKEVGEAEESIKRGFALIRRDIEAELATIKKMNASKAVKAEEVERERALLSDLKLIEETVGKEVWDIRVSV